MNREATKYCEECKNCLSIERQRSDFYCVYCEYRAHTFDEVVYCKYKKLKKENKRNA